MTLGPFSSESLNPKLNYEHLASANVCIGVGAILPIIGGFLKKSEKNQSESGGSIALDQLITFVTGLIFGIGLLVAGMVRRVNILGFLGLGKDWNPSLMFVLGCGVIVNLAIFSYMIYCK